MKYQRPSHCDFNDQDLIKAAKLLHQLHCTESDRAKRKLLAYAFSKRKRIANVFRWGLDPFIYFGVRSKAVSEDNYGQATGDTVRSCLFDMSKSMHYGLVLDRLTWRLNRSSPKVATLVKCLLDKNLRSGIRTEDVNRALKKAKLPQIPQFRLPIAIRSKTKNVWSKIESSKYTWYGRRDYPDSHLRLCILSPYSDPMVFDANGRPFLDCPRLRDDLTDYSGKHGVVVCCGGVAIANAEGEYDFAGIRAGSRELDNDPSFRFFVYDMVPFTSFIRGRGPSYSKRQHRLRQLVQEFHSPRIVLAESVKLFSEENWKKLLREARINEWSGLIVQRDVPYKAGRVRSMRKVRPQ